MADTMEDIRAPYDSQISKLTKSSKILNGHVVSIASKFPKYRSKAPLITEYFRDQLGIELTSLQVESFWEECSRRRKHVCASRPNDIKRMVEFMSEVFYFAPTTQQNNKSHSSKPAARKDTEKHIIKSEPLEEDEPQEQPESPQNMEFQTEEQDESTSSVKALRLYNSKLLQEVRKLKDANGRLHSANSRLELQVSQLRKSVNRYRKQGSRVSKLNLEIEHLFKVRNRLNKRLVKATENLPERESFKPLELQNEFQTESRESSPELQ